MFIRTVVYVAICFSIAFSSVEHTQEELQHKNDFIAFDLNHDGYVDASEVRQQFEGLRQQDLSAFFIAADKNEDGLISLDEYLHASYKNDAGELNLKF